MHEPYKIQHSLSKSLTEGMLGYQISIVSSNCRSFLIMATQLRDVWSMDSPNWNQTRSISKYLGNGAKKFLGYATQKPWYLFHYLVQQCRITMLWYLLLELSRIDITKAIIISSRQAIFNQIFISLCSIIPTLLWPVFEQWLWRWRSVCLSLYLIIPIVLG